MAKNNMSFTIKGIESVNKYLDLQNNEFTMKAKKGINNATLFMLGEVKQSIAGRRAEPASVDTGRFLNSVNSEVDALVGKVFTNLNYALFLEYGSTKLKARKHFNNSLRRNKNKVQNIISSAIKKKTV